MLPSDADRCDCRSELSLYVHVSNISWKLHNAESKISGTYCSPGKKDVRIIDIDSAGKSQFDIINSIWAMMD